jgi:hypothetical protein
MRVRHSRWALLAVVAGGWALALIAGAAPAGAEGGTGAGSQVVVSGRVVVSRGEQVERVVILHGPVRVAGSVRHDVVAFDGDVTVSGTVGGDVTTTNGSVHVTSAGTVGGRIATDRSARIEPGATVGGGVDRIDERWTNPLFVLGARGLVWLAVSFSTLALGAVVVFAAPRAVNALTRAGRESIARSIGWGICLSFGLPAAGVILALTLLGIPLAVGLLAALALLYPFGYVVGALVLGGLAVGRSGSPWVALLIGWGVLRVAALMPWLALYTWVAATIYGLGATAVVVWRVRDRTTPTGGASPIRSTDLSAVAHAGPPGA